MKTDVVHTINFPLATPGAHASRCLVPSNSTENQSADSPSHSSVTPLRAPLLLGRSNGHGPRESPPRHPHGTASHRRDAPPRKQPTRMRLDLEHRPLVESAPRLAWSEERSRRRREGSLWLASRVRACIQTVRGGRGTCNSTIYATETDAQAHSSIHPSKLAF